jgi:hypothetical protein
MKSMLVGACMLALTLMCQTAGAGTTLITSNEAALPPVGRTMLASTLRGITRGPTLVLRSPEATVTSPFNLRFEFQAHGGSTIKPESFHLIYIKKPRIDLTSRVRPFVTETGVDMAEAEAPPGRHVVEAEITDSDGRATSVIFVLNVIK